jgi:hypothetical protein
MRYQLPSRGWGPWRQEFYSFHSSPRLQREDAGREFGSWRNVWVAKFSRFVFARWPDFWRWWVNTKIMKQHSRSWHDLRRCFQNLNRQK